MILDTTETVATFLVDGDQQPFEIDHLGITDPALWGQYTVSHRRRQVAAFTIAVPGPSNATRSKVASGQRARPLRAPAAEEQLIELARAALPPELLEARNRTR